MNSAIKWYKRACLFVLLMMFPLVGTLEAALEAKVLGERIAAILSFALEHHIVVVAMMGMFLTLPCLWAALDAKTLGRSLRLEHGILIVFVPFVGIPLYLVQYRHWPIWLAIITPFLFFSLMIASTIAIVRPFKRFIF